MNDQVLGEAMQDLHGYNPLKEDKPVAKEVQRWADDAMFKAEPLKASDGIKVFMLAGTPDPLGAVAAMSKMYKGEVVRDFADVTREEREEFLREILKTKLKAPLEAVKMHFMVEGVTRSFTHQMVRQRTAVYAQESLRFAVKEDMAEGVAYPPSLIGVDDWEGIGERSTDQEMLAIWDNAVNFIDMSYNRLVNMGMPAEDARGLLPHNVTTRLNYVTDLRALQDHGGNRLCTQAQFEWRIYWVRLLDAMRHYCSNPVHGSVPQALHEGSSHACDNWQWVAIADIFRPVCYLTGKCEFKANFDRKCSIRDRVEANHNIGRPSDDWSGEYDHVKGNPIVAGVGPRSVVRDEEDTPVFIGAIQPREWLLDAGAAR
jgi:flavin-dependent thymidylate synthase